MTHPTALPALAAAALVLAIGGVPASAQSNAPPINAAPTATTTGDPQSTPSVSPASPQAQNPGVNPSAAGAQPGPTNPNPDYRPGYGSSGNGSAPPTPKL